MSNLRQDLQDAHDLLVGVGESFWAGKIQKIPVTIPVWNGMRRSFVPGSAEWGLSTT